jgi:hypothetical protein
MSALEDFELGVGEVELLRRICQTDPSPGEKSDRDNAVLRAGVVLLVSHFESYLKATAENFCDVLSTGKLETRQIPRGVRELHTLPRLSAILECNDSVQRGALLKKLGDVTVLWNESAKPSPGTLRASIISRVVTNAYGETIDELFTIMGSSTLVCDGDLDVPGSDGDFSPVNIRLGCTDVVKCRNDIAHGDTTRRPTDEDLGRYIRFLTALARRLDRKANALIEVVSP